MNKPLLGLVAGGLLGVLDGLSALFSAPDDATVRAQIGGIVMMGVFKGVVAGLVIGAAARKTGSLVAGALIGLGVGLALALPVALMTGAYYFEIMLPGGIVGLLIGLVTHRFGRQSTSRPLTASP